jgi:hypothetical protein
MTEGTKKGGFGCGKSMACGCVGVLGLVLLAAMALWLSKDVIHDSEWFGDISHSVETAKTEMHNLAVLRQDLDADYPTQKIDTHVQIQTGSEGTIKTLHVRLVNPEFEVPPSADGQEATARELAEAIADRYPGLERYDALRIALVFEREDTASFSTVTTYAFKTAELLGDRPSTP